MTDAAEQAVLKVLDAKGWTKLIDLWVHPALINVSVDDIGRALCNLLERNAVEADPKTISYRIKAEQIHPGDFDRALGDHY